MKPIQKFTGAVSPSMQDALACMALLAAIFSIYAQVGGHRPIAFDDALYLTDNRWVLQGLTWDGIVWAFINFDAANWHPVTWLSHMIDREIFGSLIGAHMIENVFWHAGNSMLVYALLKRFGFARLLSFSLAAVFACHPLNVESVAWLSQRKTQISTFLLLCTVLTYLDWRVSRRITALILLVGAYAVSLMAKAMGVTLPIILVALEATVLLKNGGGVASSNSWRDARNWLVRTSINIMPLVIVAGAVAFATILAQRQIGAVATLEYFPVMNRIANALAATGVYIRTFFWPADLCFFYPLNPDIDWPGVALGCALVALILICSFYNLRKAPLIIFGSGWFLIALLPVIGLVQVGSQSHADRYMYLPMIGLLIAVGAYIQRIGRERDGVREVFGAGCITLFAVSMGANAYAYAMAWRNPEIAYRNAIRVAGPSYSMVVGLTAALMDLNYLKTAEPWARLAVERWPTRPLAQSNLASVYARMQKYELAEIYYCNAVALDPLSPRLLYMLGLTLIYLERDAEAEVAFQRARALLDEPGEWRTGDRFVRAVLTRKVRIPAQEAKRLIDVTTRE